VIVTPWYERIAAIGHGTSTEMTPDEAIEIANKHEPDDPHEWSPEGQDVGLRCGDRVSVVPDDYGSAVFGNILAWTTDEIIIRHEDPSVGRVNLHFPRGGFDVAPAQTAA
jgi:glutathione S-transferase